MSWEDKMAEVAEAIEKPLDEVEVMFGWLDQIRLGGSINMFGAAGPLAEMFGLRRAAARKVHVAWMETFGERAADPLATTLKENGRCAT